MQCPKCAHENPATAIACGRCGIVFEKYYKYHPRPGEAAPASAAVPLPRPGVRRAAPQRDGLWGLILPADPKGDWVTLAARALVLVGLVIWGLSMMTSSVASGAVGQSFLHNVNLPFHEAGHVIFRPFGQFITSLGGTLGQLLMPAIALGVLLVQTRDPFGASVALWWFGQNFLDIAPYINDARAGVLPLVGGNFGHSAPYGFHDWEYLLTETGLLHSDQALARGSHLLGSLIILLALVWGGAVLFGQYRAARRAGPI